MGIVHNLSLLTLRPVVGAAQASLPPGDGIVAGWLSERFTLIGPRLAAALQQAGARAWLALELAVAGVSHWEHWQEAPTLTAHPSLRDQLRAFLDQASLGPIPEDESFREDCARELRTARKKDSWVRGLPEPAELAQRAAVWALAPEVADPADAERDLLERTIEELRQRSAGHLAQLLQAQLQEPPALLVLAARCFFRRARERDPILVESLPEPAEETTTAEATRGLLALADALDRYTAEIEALLEERPAVEAEPSPRDGLDLRRELARQSPPLQTLSREVLALLDAHRLDRRGLRPSDILTLRTPEERQRVRQLAARCREIPEEQARQAPALINAVGKLQALAGDLEQAFADFQKALSYITELQPQAEVYANAYQVALEQRQFDEALTCLNKAAARDPERYAPFPLTKYEAEKILSNDGFGVTFLCRHRNAGTQVVVRALRTDVLERRAEDVFHDAQILDTLEYPAIARLRDCDFADADQLRPYMVHDHFGGVPLSDYLARHGALSAADVLAVARPVAEALQAAHQRNLLHTSIQPAHILVRKDDGGWRVKLINFGLSLRRSVIRDVLDRPDARARLALGQSVASALECAAPEQLGRLDNTPVGPAADIYAFGRTCYAALLRATEPDDQEKEQLDPLWRKLLGQCTSWTVNRRVASFAVVLERLAQAPSAAPAAKPDPEESAACVQRGIASRQKGEMDQALAEFNRAVLLDPHNALAFQGRGNTYSTKGDFDRAIADYSKALELDPKLPLSYVNRGLAHVKKKQTDKAIADYSKALEIDATLAVAYLNRGSAYARQGDYDRAITDFTEALRLDKAALAYLNRGLAFAKRGDLDRAIADYDKALEMEPGNREVKARKAEAEKIRARNAPDKPIRPARQLLEEAPTGKAAKEARKQAERDKTNATPPAAPRPGEAAPTKKVVAPTGKMPVVSPEAPAGKAPASKAPEKAPAEAPAAKTAPGKAPEKAAEAPAGKAPAGKAAEKAPPVAAAPASEQLRVLEGHTDAVRCVIFSGDGRRLATGSEDKTIRLWDPRSGKKLGRFTGHAGGVISVAFSPNGQLVLSGSQDHTVRLWSVETGEEVRRFGSGGRFFGGGGGHTDAVVSVAFSPDGTRAVSASWDKTVRVWDVDSGKELRALEGHMWLIHSVAFVPDGAHVVYGSEDQTVRLWNIDTGEEVRRFSGHGSWVLSVAVSADGRQVLSGGSDGTMRLWSVARGKELRRFGGQGNLVQSVAFTPSGKHALSGEYTLTGENPQMRVWEVESALEMARFTGHTNLIWSVACAPDGQVAATASADQTVRLWRLPKTVAGG